MNNKLTQAELNEIDARVAAATPGPWAAMNNTVFHGELRSCDGFVVIAVMPEHDDRPDDFVFMADAKSDIPRLRSYIEGQKDDIAAMGMGILALSLLLVGVLLVEYLR